MLEVLTHHYALFCILICEWIRYLVAADKMIQVQIPPDWISSPNTLVFKYMNEARNNLAIPTLFFAHPSSVYSSFLSLIVILCLKSWNRKWGVNMLKRRTDNVKEKTRLAQPTSSHLRKWHWDRQLVVYLPEIPNTSFCEKFKILAKFYIYIPKGWFLTKYLLYSKIYHTLQQPKTFLFLDHCDKMQIRVFTCRYCSASPDYNYHKTKSFQSCIFTISIVTLKNNPRIILQKIWLPKKRQIPRSAMSLSTQVSYPTGISSV